MKRQKEKRINLTDDFIRNLEPIKIDGPKMWIVPEKFLNGPLQEAENHWLEKVTDAETTKKET